MAVDPRCPPHVLSAVMATPTAKRLIHLSGLTETDLATDLSSLLALGLIVDKAINGSVLFLPTQDRRSGADRRARPRV